MHRHFERDLESQLGEMPTPHADWTWCSRRKWRITPAASMRCRAPSCWHARVGKWSARPRRKGGGRGCVNWHRRKVAPEQRPTHPYVAPHTAKIHTLITLGVSILPKPLVLEGLKRLPRGFDSHRPLHFQDRSEQVGTRDWGQHVDPVGKRWERTSIWRRSRVVTCPYAAPAFTRTVTRSEFEKNVCDSHTLCAAAIVIAGGRTRPITAARDRRLYDIRNR